MSEKEFVGRVQRMCVQRKKDGRYLSYGYDSSDQWVSNPLYASDVKGFARLRDVMPYPHKGENDEYEIVEFEVCAYPTGRVTKDLFENGEATKASHDLPDLIESEENEEDFE